MRRIVNVADNRQRSSTSPLADINAETNAALCPATYPDSLLDPSLNARPGYVECFYFSGMSSHRIAICAPACRVSTRVARLSPRSFNCGMMTSGVTAVPRFLTVTAPIPR